MKDDDLHLCADCMSINEHRSRWDRFNICISHFENHIQAFYHIIKYFNIRLDLINVDRVKNKVYNQIQHTVFESKIYDHQVYNLENLSNRSCTMSDQKVSVEKVTHFSKILKFVSGWFFQRIDHWQGIWIFQTIFSDGIGPIKRTSNLTIPTCEFRVAYWIR